MLLDFLDNAIKFTPTVGAVTLAVVARAMMADVVQRPAAFGE